DLAPAHVERPGLALREVLVLGERVRPPVHHPRYPTRSAPAPSPLPPAPDRGPAPPFLPPPTGPRQAALRERSPRAWSFPAKRREARPVVATAGITPPSGS